MAGELIIKIVDPDEDYLGIEVRASNDQFAGSARIYAGLDQLSAFAACVAGFPESPTDERMYEFGDPKRSTAGGYAMLRFRCLDRSGHPGVEIAIENQDGLWGTERANLSFRIEAAGVDRFTSTLRELECRRSGEAVLPSVQ